MCGWGRRGLALCSAWLGLALGLMSTGVAEASVYMVNRSLPCTQGCTGAFTVAGSITTDGSTGSLIVEDITDVSLTFTVPGQPGVLVEGDDVLTAFGSLHFPSIGATPTSLSFTIDKPEQGISWNRYVDNDPTVPVFGYIIGTVSFAPNGVGEMLYARTGDTITALASVALTQPYAVTFNALGTPGPVVPIPAALPLMASALGLLGVMARHRWVRRAT